MQPRDAPARRADLALSPADEGGRRRTVVHDPVAGRYFRIGEVEGAIVARLDGRTTLANVHAAVVRDFPGVALSLATVVQFAERMQRLGWLDGVAGERPRRPPLYRRMLFLKIPLVRPERLFTWLLPLVRPFYTPLGLTGVALFVAITACFSLLSLTELAAARPAFTGWGTLALIWVGYTLISIPHELGHGLTCRYFGGRSPSMGFLFVYGVPAFYCDVSGAWMLPSRRQRVLIGLAGLGWQFAAAAVVFWFWRVLEPHALAARIAAVMLGLCGITALLNLLPLIRLDGYYVLSDWLGIPNLRQKAFAFWGQTLRYWLLHHDPPSVEPRERRVYRWFGIGAFAYSAFLFTTLGWWLWRALTERWAGGGAAIWLALVGVLVISWFRSRRPTGRQSMPPGGKQVSEEQAALQAPARTIRVPWRLATVCVLLIVAGWVFWNATWPFHVASPLALEATQRVGVRPRTPGVLGMLRYREGDYVAAGALIGRLDTFALEKRREELRLRIRTAQIERDVIERTVPIVAAQREFDVAEAQQEVQEALGIAEDREEEFPERRAVAERQVQEARAALDASDTIAERLRADERLIASGSLTPELQAIEEQIARVRSDRALTEKETRRTAYLVSQGALARSQLDILTNRRESQEKQEASLRSEQAAIRKGLRERREDAEAVVRHRRAGYEAALQSQRQVDRETRQSKVQVAKQVVVARESALDAAQALQGEADVKRTEAVAKALDARALQAELDRIEREIADAEIRAPAAGVISTPRLEERLGQHLTEGETLCWIDQTGDLEAHIFIDQKEIGHVQAGQSVALRLGAFPLRTVAARVEEIATRSELTAGVESYEVRLSIPNEDGVLRPGMQGFAKVLSGRRPLREVVFYRLNRYLRTEVWTWF